MFRGWRSEVKCAGRAANAAELARECRLDHASRTVWLVRLARNSKSCLGMAAGHARVTSAG